MTPCSLGTGRAAPDVHSEFSPMMSFSPLPASLKKFPRKSERVFHFFQKKATKAMVSFLLKLQKCTSDVAFRLSDWMCVGDLSAGYKLNQLLRH